MNKHPIYYIVPLLLLIPSSICITPPRSRQQSPPPFVTTLRGGSSSTTTTTPPSPLQTYLVEQHHLHTLRATILSEYLAHTRNLPLPTLRSVQTPDGTLPPAETDWDCAVSLPPDDPKSCLYSFEAPSGAKVIAPAGTDQWITLSALNRLRRTDPTKVQPMWHDKYAVLESWFRDGEFSVMGHVGFWGFVVSHVLLDRPVVLKVGIKVLFLAVVLMTLPVWEYVVNRVLVSGVLWRQYKSWGRIVHAAFPLKFLIGQMGWKFVAGQFDGLEGWMRSIIVEVECGILEERIPVTVGGDFEEEEDIEEYVDEEDDAESEEW